MRERLDVLHERRPPPDAALERPRRRERRQRRAAVELIDQRGLLAGDECASGRNDAHPDAVVALGAARDLERRDRAARRHTRRDATIASRAPTTVAASTAPSSTRCGAVASSTLSLRAAGSPSAPFTTTTGAPAARDRRELAARSGSARRRARAGRCAETASSSASGPVCGSGAVCPDVRVERGRLGAVAGQQSGEPAHAPAPDTLRTRPVTLPRSASTFTSITSAIARPCASRTRASSRFPSSCSIWPR